MRSEDPQSTGTVRNMQSLVENSHLANMTYGSEASRTLWFSWFKAHILQTTSHDHSKDLYDMWSNNQMYSSKVEAAGEPLSGCNPSGSADPSRPCNARWLSSRTFPEHPESEWERTQGSL